MSILDLVNFKDIQTNKFNIIPLSTGTGKTYMMLKHFNLCFPNIKQYEVLFITSRSLTVDQQSKSDSVEKYNKNNSLFVKHWSGEKNFLNAMQEKGIQIMTYDKIIDILIKKNSIGFQTLEKIKLVIIDECHTLFSDKFIKNIEAFKVWIRDIIYTKSKTFIGLTATPNILFYYKKQWGIEINDITDKEFCDSKYMAKQLYCTNFDTIPYLIKNVLYGKTLIMCYSLSDCNKLKKDIDNSFILISKSNKNFTKAMDKVRQYIVDNEDIPSTFVENGEEKELNVLITTSTLREGINLKGKCEIKNIICCFSDELHITQFVGRCRYNIENLIVADTYINSDNISDSYFKKCRKSFKQFIYGKENFSWFTTISHLIEHNAFDTKKIILNKNEKQFVDFINNKWLVPKNMIDKKILEKYRIYRKEDKDEIINMAIKCKLFDLFFYRITFNRIINFMMNDLGYTVENNIGRTNKQKYTYKLVVDFDEIFYLKITKEKNNNKEN